MVRRFSLPSQGSRTDSFLGKLATVQQLVHAIEKDEASFSFEDHHADPATVGGVLKVDCSLHRRRSLADVCQQLYLRQLPFPLFPFVTAEYAFSFAFLRRG